MDIYIPKYKQIYIKDGSLDAPGTGLRGEYKFVLRGPDGRIKQESDWQPNLILNYGMANILSGYLSYMHLGTSSTTPAETQTGIIGTWLGGAGSVSPRGGNNTGTPNYDRYYTTDFLYDVGVATGNITEGVLAFGSSESDGRNKGFCRFLFTTPINKGAQDSLTLTYRLWMYTDITDKTGTINISGEDYDYVCRPWGVGFNGEFWYLSHIPDVLKFKKSGGGYGTPYGKTDQALYANTHTLMGTNDVYFGPCVDTYGGTLPTYYATMTSTSDVDTGNATFNWMGITSLYRYTGNGHETSGLQWSLKKTSDQSPFVKEDTHEFVFQYRTFVSRYTP